MAFASSATVGAALKSHRGTAGDGGDHRCHHGAFYSPEFSSAYGYAVPRQLFRNGIFNQVVYRLNFNPLAMIPGAQRHRGTDHHEFVLHTDGVQIACFYLITNASVIQGVHRL